ncbi:hypothetical protein LOTGIDRAFT_158654 [Lottia gigantea]|uniref:Endonuclease/exonuclease/phosphatase domain-containing protein n=1 Tax=Lottia gigantea TaxID=225164 RepID=V4AYH5_LOTGI|nr:hypothetical protein LOTGIDRAFT_158654 [Lottia gigantea]ESO98706.1 hypothetical protein LOTGIDRAFT_158654 [Lottia gigantea]
MQPRVARPEFSNIVIVKPSGGKTFGSTKSKVIGDFIRKEWKFIQLNINGLNVPERKTQLVQLLQRKQYDAVFLQESKLGSRNKDPIINGYTLIRLNRPNALNHRSGGGLAIYIKNGISHSEVPLKTIAPLEAQAVSFTDKSKFFSIVNIYRPEVKGKPQRFSEYQYVYDQLPGTDNIVLGDFNAKHVLWGSPTTDTNGRQVAEFIEANDLVSINDGSITYVGAIAPLGSHLDLTLVNSRLAKDCTWEATSETLGRDHVVIEITLSRNVVKEEVMSEVISEIRRMIHNYQTNNNQKIELVWVPSHVSIPGNDQTDRCAKESLSLEDIKPVEYSYSEFCSIVSSRINQKWADMLRNLDTARYQIDPKIPNQTKPNHPSVAICKVATRLRTNNVLRDHQFNAIKCRFGHVATRSHVFIQCTELKPARLRVFQQITDNLTKPNQTNDYHSTTNQQEIP